MGMWSASYFRDRLTVKYSIVLCESPLDPPSLIPRTSKIRIFLRRLAISCEQESPEKEILIRVNISLRFLWLQNGLGVTRNSTQLLLVVAPLFALKFRFNFLEALCASEFRQLFSGVVTSPSMVLFHWTERLIGDKIRRHARISPEKVNSRTHSSRLQTQFSDSTSN
ncbi:hypothetical protein BDV95DRAFT_84828 [Massariosphaeria phaeospora]|uniref:Uncharacterized protein n=1 Tax=Massariosphaeria phaeospora TaxID=100035 RepID=A0A7C8I5D8_9PLEO|nr:hypothetical protein BDV95DRAFT_84828 [Massariosphaeria phaeospora]